MMFNQELKLSFFKKRLSHALYSRGNKSMFGDNFMTKSLKECVVYFLVDLLMDGEILKDIENTLIYDAMFFLPN